MKKDEYMGALKSALVGFDEELVQEIITDYEERFRVGAERGKTEEQVIRELGSIKDLVEELGEFKQSAGSAYQSEAGTEPVKTIIISQTFGDTKKDAEQNHNVTGAEQAQNIGTTAGSGEQEGAKGDYGQEEDSGYRYQENSTGSFHNQSSGNDWNHGKQSDNRQSGTYYQEKSFSESFDSAMRKFGRALDGVMKEAGRVIEEAAAQFEMHMEEAKKNKYYTYNGDGTFQGSEKEGDAEPNVEQSGQGSVGCRRVVVEADFADVKIRSTKEAEPKAVCHYYSHKTAMMYPFYAYQEGDTFRVGVRRNQDSERKSGFFQFSMSPSIEIELFLPEGVVLVEAGSSSGNLELNEITVDELALHSKSGDITANYVTCGRCSMEAMSGDLQLLKSSVKMAELTTKSGDSTADRLEAERLSVNTASGDARVKSVQTDTVIVSTMSGDIGADALQSRSAKFHTASGDMSLNDMHGEMLEASSASGDINVRADYKGYMVKSQSGDVSLESRHDADISANSTSGDVDVRIVEALETYQVTMHSVSGECNTFGQTKSEDPNPSRTIEAKTISGDIKIRFL